MSVKKLFATLAVTVLLIALFVLPISADSPRVIDGAGMFTDSELSELNTAIAEAEEKSGVMFFVVTEEYHYENKSAAMSICNASSSDDVCILVIESDLHYYFYTNGLADKRISDGEADDILDDSGVYGNIKSGRVFEGAMRFLEMTPNTIEIPYTTIIIVGIVIGAIAAGITVGVVISKYKMKLRPTNYPLDQFAKLDLTHNEDHFIGKHVSVVVTSSGSSGGRSGGGHSGGGARGSR